MFGAGRIPPVREFLARLARLPVSAASGAEVCVSCPLPSSASDALFPAVCGESGLRGLIATARVGSYLKNGGLSADGRRLEIDVKWIFRKKGVSTK